MRIVGALCMLLIGMPAWAGTFRDNFGDGDLNGWLKWEWPGQNTGRLEERDGILIITDVDSRFDTVAAFNNRQRVGDFTLAVDAKMTKANEGGKSYMEIWVRTVEEKNGDWRGVWNIYYASGEAFILLYTLIGMNERRVEEIKLPFTLELDKWYRIKLDTNGTDIILWIDGELIQEVDWRVHKDTLPEAGEIMIGVGGGESHWDNFAITGDEVPDYGFAVEPVGRLATVWGQIRGADADPD